MHWDKISTKANSERDVFTQFGGKWSYPNELCHEHPQHAWTAALRILADSTASAFLGLVMKPSRHLESHGHGWVHLLFTVSVREGGLDLPVARL